MEKYEYHRPTSEVLKIGRDFQNTDNFRGYTFDTAKLLCDHIERLDAFVTEMSGVIADIYLSIAKKMNNIPMHVTPHEVAIVTRCERILDKVNPEILTDYKEILNGHRRP